MRLDLNAPAVVSAVNNASYSPGQVAPQEIATLFGPGIAEGISVQIQDRSGSTQLAPLFSVSAGQANIRCSHGSYHHCLFRTRAL
ncbi:MAG TPA: hypothetical protein VGG72_19610 [Bryobacteraceae bacterium]